MQRLWTPKGRVGLVAIGALAVVAVGLGMAVSEGDARAQSRAQGGYLGVTLQDINDELRESYGYRGAGGVLVSSVDGAGPAAEAGLRQGDIILRYKGTSVESVDDLAERVRQSEPGETATVSAWRSGRERSFKVELGSRAGIEERGGERRRIVIDDDDHRIEIDPEDLEDLEKMKDFIWVQPHMEHWEDIADDIRVQVTRRARLGVRTQDLNEQLGEYFGVSDGSGVLVTEVIEDTPADAAGFRAGDVITEVDGERIGDSSELRKELAEKGEGEVRIRILRKGTPRSLTAELEEPREPRHFSFRGHPGRQGYHYRGRDSDGPHRRYWSDGDMEKLREQLREMQRELSKMRRELRDMDDERD